MNIYSQISSNKFKTWLIIGFFMVFITTIAFVFANNQIGIGQAEKQSNL